MQSCTSKLANGSLPELHALKHAGMRAHVGGNSQFHLCISTRIHTCTYYNQTNQQANQHTSAGTSEKANERTKE